MSRSKRSRAWHRRKHAERADDALNRLAPRSNPLDVLEGHELDTAAGLCALERKPGEPDDELRERMREIFRGAR